MTMFRLSAFVLSLMGARLVASSYQPPESSSKLLTLPLVHHDEIVRRRGLSKSTDPVTMASLYQGYGTHYVDLWVGKPPQRQTLIVDTGSSTTAFPCSQCKSDCGDGYHIDDAFDESASPSFHFLQCGDCVDGFCDSEANKCRVHVGYQEGSSWTANEGKDTVYVGGFHDQGLADKSNKKDENPTNANAFAFEGVFACQYMLTGLFKTQLADGIMGMDPSENSFWQQMVDVEAIDKPIFTLCYAHKSEHTHEGTGAGALTLGGIDTRLHTSPMAFAKMSLGTGLAYFVDLRKVYLRAANSDDASLSIDKITKFDTEIKVLKDDLSPGGTIVDSGTTHTYLSNYIKDEFNAAFKKLTGQDYVDRPTYVNEENLETFPTIVLQLVGVTSQTGNSIDSKHANDVLIAIPPSHYFEYSTAKKAWKSLLHFRGSSSVLGGSTMRAHDVAFDNDKSRVGFAESECNYESLYSSESSAPSTSRNNVDQTVGDDALGDDADGYGDDDYSDDDEGDDDDGAGGGPEDGTDDGAGGGPDDGTGDGTDDGAGVGPDDVSGGGPDDVAGDGPDDGAGGGPDDVAGDGPDDGAGGGPDDGEMNEYGDDEYGDDGNYGDEDGGNGVVDEGGNAGDEDESGFGDDGDAGNNEQPSGNTEDANNEQPAVENGNTINGDGELVKPKEKVKSPKKIPQDNSNTNSQEDQTEPTEGNESEGFCNSFGCRGGLAVVFIGVGLILFMRWKSRTRRQFEKVVTEAYREVEMFGGYQEDDVFKREKRFNDESEFDHQNGTEQSDENGYEDEPPKPPEII